MESVVFLRAVRPHKNNDYEQPDFHRETFYSDHSHTPFVLNTWIPVLNVNDFNTLQYVPESHLIPDENIECYVDQDYPSKVEKYSSGHKLGFFWKPKRIKSGVDLSNAKLMHFNKYDYSLFSSMLVHGNAINKTDQIRFAIGFGLIPKSKLIENKKFFASGGKDHFIDYN